ncbi:MAG: hypothetical protein JSV26_09775 [bacterium]|nr:MAG: hypothetical protein JSV26_09775 [bacterium]
MRVRAICLGIPVVITISFLFSVQPLFAGGIPPGIPPVNPAGGIKPSPILNVSGGGYLENGAKVGFGAVAAGEKVEGHFHLVSNLSDGKASAVLLQIVDCRIDIIEIDCQNKTASMTCSDGTIIEIISGDHFDPFNNGAVSVYTEAAGYLFGATDPYALVNHGFVSARCTHNPFGPVYTGMP